MKIKRNCLHCQKEFYARQADINRGWGKFCSKSCKAKYQVKYNPKSKYHRFSKKPRIVTDLTYDSSSGTFFTTVEKCEFCGKFDCEC